MILIECKIKGKKNSVKFFKLVKFNDYLLIFDEKCYFEIKKIVLFKKLKKN